MLLNPDPTLMPREREALRRRAMADPETIARERLRLELSPADMERRRTQTPSGQPMPAPCVAPMPERKSGPKYIVTHPGVSGVILDYEDDAS